MRIIAGLAKGRGITAVADSTRPTSDRAREALFSSLASEFGDFDGLNILDLYIGCLYLWFLCMFLLTEG